MSSSGCKVCVVCQRLLDLCCTLQHCLVALLRKVISHLLMHFQGSLWLVISMGHLGKLHQDPEACYVEHTAHHNEQVK